MQGQPICVQYEVVEQNLSRATGSDGVAKALSRQLDQDYIYKDNVHRKHYQYFSLANTIIQADQ